MRVTRIGRIRPVSSISQSVGGIPGGPSGQVPTATGSNGEISWGSNVAVITANSSNAVLGPYVNFASGTGISLAVASNTMTIAATGGGGSVSFGSNSNAVGEANAPGASSNASRADHVHLGVRSIAHASNTFSGPVIFTASGALGITSPTPGTLNFSATGGSGGAGSSLTIEEVDGSPTVAASKLVLPNGTLGVVGTVATYTPAASGGGDLVFIAETVLGSPAANITHTGIPNTYRDLVCVVQARSTAVAEFDTLSLLVGDGSIDTGNNYSAVRNISGSGSATLGGRGQSSITLLTVAAANATAGAVGGIRFDILGYHNTSFFKIIEGGGYMDGATDHYISSLGAVWRNASGEIDQLRIVFASAANLVTGSRFAVYGRT